MKDLGMRTRSWNLSALMTVVKYRNKYQSIFGDAPVKLDLFHACQRVCKTLLHDNHPLKKSLEKEFGLIFRHDHDQGEIRLQNTPSEEKILQNLDIFLNKWSNVEYSPLRNETFEEIQKLKKHVDKGCLSGIPPGLGTERNEQLHRLLNRSMLSGATRISVELAVAILTVVFFYHSSRATPKKHKCNSRIICTSPIEANSAKLNDKENLPTFSFPFKRNTRTAPSFKDDSLTMSANSDDHLPDTIIIAEEIEDVYTEFVSRIILDSSRDMYDIIVNLQAKKHSRAFEALDVLGIVNMPDVITVQSMFGRHEDNMTIKRHLSVLERNLSAFRLEIEEVNPDGDCAFRSIVKQIHMLSNDDEKLKRHLESLNLMKTEDEDTFQLRQLFVEEILSADDELISFLPQDDMEDLKKKANDFRSPGVFDKMLGDLVMKACSQLLQLPIIVITSNEAVSYLPFVPDQLSSKEPAFLAFHYYGAGHYDSTKSAGEEKYIPTVENTKRKGCSCGIKYKTREKSCVERTISSEKKRMCPCVGAKQMCSVNCRCRGCQNKEKPKETFCRCGEGKKEIINYVSCHDEQGQRKTKCP